LIDGYGEGHVEKACNQMSARTAMRVRTEIEASIRVAG
jgi:hypothetical protein